jgi:hypothetical protein
MPKIEIEIGADNSDLKKKIKEVEFDVKELAKVKVDRIKLGLDTTEITAQIKDTKATLTGLRSTLKDTGDSFTAMKPKVANGSNALMQFSRIAQDAPFGIMGIGNNITATTEAFGYLKQSTGSASGALKAMASSLIGSGGILLAVSLVTSAFTYMSMNGISVGDVIDKVTGKFNAFGESLKKAYDESAKSALEETGALKGLIAVAQSETVSREARTQAVEDLQSKYPAYFGNLSKEEIMYGNLTGVVNEVTKALINKGIAEKLSKDAIGPTLDLYKANALLVSQKEKQIQLERDLATELKKTKEAGFGGATNATVNLRNAIKNNGFAIKETRGDIVDLTKVVDSYESNISRVSQASSKLLIKAPAKTKAGKSSSPTSSTTVNTPEIAPLASSLLPTGLVPVIGAQLMAEIPAIKLATEAISAELLAFNDNANQLIMGSITDTFAGLGSALGEALATGGNVLNALGKSLLNSLGSFLGSLGKQMIAFGITALFFDKTKKSLFSGVGTPAAAIGLIAAGAALSTIGSAIGSMASKGSGTGGASTNTGGGTYQSSGGSNAGFSSGSGGGTVVFRISGQDLIGVLSNTLDKNSRLGGAISL